MAYNQEYYQAPQRPYNGRAAQPPAQTYPPNQQQYAQQGPYDQYPQEEYGYNDYDQGHAQEYNSNQHQQPSYGDGRGARGGGGGTGRGNYAPQDQNYPPPQQQDPYGNAGRGRPPPPQDPYSNGGGRGAPPPRHDSYNNGDSRGGPPDMRSPPGRGDGRGTGAPYGPPRGGYDGRGGTPRGAGAGGPPMGRGGRPGPPDRSFSSDPGAARRGPPLAPIQPSSQELSWDSPFPGFPGAKKKPARNEEQNMVRQMSNMDINDGQIPRPRTSGSNRSQDVAQRGAPPGDGYGRPSGENQSNMPPRGYPPQQPQQGGYGSSQRGQAPPPPRQDSFQQPTYSDAGGYRDQQLPISPMRDGFGPLTRSSTMPNDMDATMARSGPRYPPPHPMDVGPSAPYNGPVGRMPPRPATATGARPTQRPQPPPQAQPPMPVQSNQNSQPGAYSHQQSESISDLYDSYFDNGPPSNGRAPSLTSDMPDFDAVPPPSESYRRGTSIDAHLGGGINVGGPRQPLVNDFAAQNGTTSHSDYRAQVHSQSATYEMAGETPPVPNGQPQRGSQDSRYDQQYGSDNGNAQGARGGYGNVDYGSQQDYGQAPRVMSGPSGPGVRGPPTGAPGYNNGTTGPRTNSLTKSVSPANSLPAHPTPVRAGLIPNSAANQANNKPPPIRNYNNTSPAQGGPNPAQKPGSRSPHAPAVTHDELEHLRITCRNNPSDQNAQLTLARKLVLAADIIAPLMPNPKDRTKARERFIMDAHKLLKKLAALNNTDAMFFLADCYGRGSLGLETDNKEAFTLYQSAAKAGHAAAAYRTAVCCELGNEEGGGTRKDPLKAIQWYKRAAMLGDTPAMYKMGMIQLNGLLGQPKNQREAVSWLKRAAERADGENPHALHELGLLYESVQPPDGSSSVIRDEAYSFQLFSQAAELGYKFSQFRLGCAYEYGLFNLPIDPRLSIMWYSRAAVQEEHQSELALSGWYLTGSEVQGRTVLAQSDTEAYLWARKAAMAGLAKAEYAMGYFTEVGIGAPSDFEGAKRWYWRAAAQNFPKARERLEDLKKGGGKGQLKSRERISRSKVGKQNEGECAVM